MIHGWYWLKFILSLFFCFLCFGCDKNINHPHPGQSKKENIYYASFSEQPKTLDPARSYSSNEAIFTANIYEPVLQYHYLQRPYVLVPLTALSVPSPRYYDIHHKPVSEQAPINQIAYSIYEIQIRPGIYYQPHPAFAKNKKGQPLYFHLTAQQLKKISALSDFPLTATRELTAADYVYEIKRLASPITQSPILSLMQEHLFGLKELNETLRQAYEKQTQLNVENTWLNLNNFKFAGAYTVNRYTFRVIIQGKYPQFLYWLAMPFFAPIPWEADKFYAQKGLSEKNINFDWYPVGTGPYMLAKNDPNREMLLVKNPNFHNELYPYKGETDDKSLGYLFSAGQALPFIDVFHFSLEKESIPRWTKFLQGYYDQSGVGSDQYDQIIQIDEKGTSDLSEHMKSKNVQLQSTVSSAIYYLGFNMLDETVGGYSEKARKLRQAISIAVNFDEFISIFLNGRGIIAQGPIPSGIFGYSLENYNSFIFEQQNGQIKRKSLAYAKKLLTAAGYPNGRNPKTGEPLVINFDTPLSSAADDKSRFDWFRAQFSKLGIDLQIRATQYNQFQEKMRKGNAQMFMWGWQADYPDPENFLFLLYGPNSQVKTGGENSANYANSEFDRLFLKMKNRENSPERYQIIQKMQQIVEQDAPWVWGFYPKDLSLAHEWVYPIKPNTVGHNGLKYIKINSDLRQKRWQEWNKPLMWPLVIIFSFLGLLIFLSVWLYRRKQNKIPARVFLE
jgi:oligopeptide transport system substrate-binding protein